jgi:ribosomal protein S18 acetylase RimI-like enzyme
VPDAVSAVQRAERWRSILGAQRPGEANFVTCDGNGTIVGFGSSGPQRHPAFPYDGEFYGIYVLRRAQGRGHGRSLMQAMARSLRAADAGSASLGVARDNIPACQFYGALGGRLMALSSAILAGVAIESAAYGWGSLADFAGLRPRSRPVHS